MVKRTRNITIEEYGSPFTYNRTNDIQNLVNIEAWYEWAKTPNGELRSIKRQKVVLPQWVKNLLKGSLGALLP